MTRAFVIRPNAEAEVMEAVDWYGERSPNLAARFSREFRATLARIGDNPFQYQLIDDEIRRAPVAGFQYGVLYVASDNEIVILSCCHGRRDPANRPAGSHE
jgi:plasmid stabilization system protein ParE